MLAVKDSCVLINLARSAILTQACDYFGGVIIPPLVREEVLDRGSPYQEDALLIAEQIETGKIRVVNLKASLHWDMLDQLNIRGGEAEAVALYRQENADWLATDDDNVRRKRYLLKIQPIGTPAILVRLFRDKVISNIMFLRAVETLRETGWFSPIVYDTLLAEANND
ncbi:hypothetical protein HY641_02940 [Candidatus Woesearchaeota archaeon]|nr:hypothetical protein [Candidatus Woesearchaeota archaeon]